MCSKCTHVFCQLQLVYVLFVSVLKDFLLTFYYDNVLPSLYCMCVFSDWVLGPDEEMLKANSEAGEDGATHMPQGLTHSHQNAFHVWDQDDVVIPLSPDDSPQTSPLLAVIPFIPHFFPAPHSVLNSPALPQPGENKSPTKTTQDAYVFPTPKITRQSSTFSHHSVSFHD